MAVAWKLWKNAFPTSDKLRSFRLTRQILEWICGWVMIRRIRAGSEFKQRADSGASAMPSPSDAHKRAVLGIVGNADDVRFQCLFLKISQNQRLPAAVKDERRAGEGGERERRGCMAFLWFGSVGCRHRVGTLNHRTSVGWRNIGQKGIRAFLVMAPDHFAPDRQKCLRRQCLHLQPGFARRPDHGEVDLVGVKQIEQVVGIGLMEFKQGFGIGSPEWGQVMPGHKSTARR